MPFQHIDGSATLDGILAVIRMARHLSLHCSSPNNRNRLANSTLPFARQMTNKGPLPGEDHHEGDDRHGEQRI
jgi:hypothetical protein